MIITTSHNCHCEVTSSQVSAQFTNMRLRGGIRVSVDQHMRIRLPLSTNCKCEKADEKADSSSCSSSDSDAEPEQKKHEVPKKVPVQKVTAEPAHHAAKPSPPKPAAPTKPVSRTSSARSTTTTDDKKITVFLNARDLPKMDNMFEGSSCDPYYMFYLEQGNGWKKMSGGPHLAIKNQRKGAWSFVIGMKEIVNSKKIKVELWDSDSLGDDDFIGGFECNSGAFLTTGGYNNAKLEGKVAKKSVIDLTYKHVGGN